MNYLIDKINNRLIEINQDPFDKQKPKIQEYLLKIEKAIQDSEENKENAIKVLKDNKLSIVGIVKTIGISRQTVYNNKEVLEEYISHAINKQDESDYNSKEKIYQEKIKQLEEEIRLLNIRDVTLEYLKLELKETQCDNSLKSEVIENLQHHN